MTNEEQEIAIERIKEILRSHNIEMDVLGCGCCGSPTVSFKYNGELILDEENETHIYMIKKDPLSEVK